MTNFSIVIPIFNEGENIISLLKEIKHSLIQYKQYEIIIVDDGSSDNTRELIHGVINHYNIVFLENNKNLGQSFSLSKGINKTKYNNIVTLDGDGQNNPSDIPKLLKIYFSSDNIKLVGGIRKKRKDSIVKIISSRIANSIRSYILNDNCTDTGCSLKVIDKHVFEILPYFDGIHRFLPALYKGYGNETIFIDVDHRPRIKGISKYGTFGRLIRGIIDLIRVKNIINQYKK